MTENIPLYGSQNATYSQMGTCHDFFSKSILPLGNAYKYDQLNRLKEAVSFTNLTSNNWGAGGTGIYQNTFGYDANGNIQTQVRKNNSGTTIDDLKYAYQQNSANKTVRNRLYHVDDGANPSTFTDDIDDMGSFVGNGTINTANNYSYDAEGRLIKDAQEQIASIEWRVDGKVKAINRTGGSSKKNLKFDYDAMGHRIAKHVLTSANVLESSTYYILDAQGNTVSTYDREIISATVYYSQKERYIYGSSRLGVMTEVIPLYGSQNATYSQTTWNDTIGRRTYELSNHLGNVLSVITDMVIPHSTNGTTVDYYLADVVQTSDYTPFGVTIPERNLFKSGVNSDYSMGFQGQLEDDQIKGEGNSLNYTFRMHDPRLGRFFAIDPLVDKYPWYSPYQFSGNKPIHAPELEGKESSREFIDDPNIRNMSKSEKASFQKGQYIAGVTMLVIADAYFTKGQITSSIILSYFANKTAKDVAPFVGADPDLVNVPIIPAPQTWAGPVGATVRQGMSKSQIREARMNFAKKKMGSSFDDYVGEESIDFSKEVFETTLGPKTKNIVQYRDPSNPNASPFFTFEGQDPAKLGIPSTHTQKYAVQLDKEYDFLQSTANKVKAFKPGDVGEYQGGGIQLFSKEAAQNATFTPIN